MYEHKILHFTAQIYKLSEVNLVYFKIYHVLIYFLFVISRYHIAIK